MPPMNRNKPKTSLGSDATYAATEFFRDFPDDAACLDWLWRYLYSADGSHARCPKCERTRRFHRVKSRPSYSCDSCGWHLHPLKGTIFEKSSTPLTHWFYAAYLMASTRCGISAKQLERELGVTYKTAWRIFNKIRSLMAQDALTLGGTFQLDESYLGGKAKNMHAAKRAERIQGRGASGKTPVFGM